MRQFRPKGARKRQQRIFAICRKIERKRQLKACILNGIYRPGA